MLGAGAVVDITGRRTVFARRWFVWLGEVSYAFYLLHWLVLHYLHVALGGRRWSAPQGVLFLIAALALALALSTLLYTLVERPVVRWERAAPRLGRGGPR